MPGKKLSAADIFRLSEAKNNFLIDTLALFENLIADSGTILTDTVFREFLDKLNVKDGIVEPGADNLRKIALVDKAWNIFQQSQGIRVITSFVSGIQEIIEKGNEYYRQAIPRETPADEILKLLNARLGITASGQPTEGGYVNRLFEDPTIRTEIREISYAKIMGGSGYQEFRNGIKEYIEGSQDKPGAFYKFYEQYAFDTYSEVDRMNAKLHADRLKLNYFLYTGGIIRDSRQFCIRNHGKVFARAQAEEWKKEVNAFTMVPGKRKALIKLYTGPIVEIPENYVPILHLGGIRCRHASDFVSDETAKALLAKQKPTEIVSFNTAEGLRNNIAAMKDQNSTTFEAYQRDGRWVQERADLHKKIVDETIAGKPKATGPKVVQMLGGAPANGKSTLASTGAVKFNKDAVFINPDDIKEKLPEYNELLKTKDKIAAPMVHEESSTISKDIRKAAIAGEKNLVIDAISDGEFEKLSKNINELKAAGYQVNIDYVTLDTETSLKYAAARYEKTGRWVPMEYVKQVNEDLPKIFPRILDENLFDELTLWDNNISNQPRKILEKKRGNLRIFDRKLYERFLDKAK